jgi:hypothetical protein
MEITEQEADALRAGSVQIAGAAEPIHHCQCGEATGERCTWSGLCSATVLVRYVPVADRDSCRSADRGGVARPLVARALRVERGCADLLVADDGEWCEVVS